MVSWPLKRIGEAFIDGEWVSLPLRESTRVTITRGTGSEGSSPRPGSMTVRVNDPDGTLSPRNVESDLYGLFGRGTRVRFRVGDVPAAPAAVMTDTFSRTESNGWGTSDSGTDWVIWDPVGSSPPASEFSVSGGAGKITTSTLNSSRFMITDGLDLGDYEATFTIATSVLPRDNNTEEGLVFTAMLRVDPVAVEVYLCNIFLLPNTGLPGGAGLRVGVNIATPSGNPSTPFQQVPGLTYNINTPLRVRVRCEGPQLRTRVWADGTPEPDHWHAQFYDASYSSGEFGFRASIPADDTAVPVTFSFDNLEITPLPEAADTVRLVGETSDIEPYEDEDGPASAYVDLDVAGVLRRYDGPQKPVQSPMRRRISRYGAQAYWTFEEGAQGDVYVAEVGEQSTAGPMRVTGLDFARDSTLVGSAPLPTVQAGGTLMATGITGETTGYWSVYLMVKLTTDGFPTDGSKHQILRFSTGTATMTLAAQLIGGAENITLDAVTSDGTALGSTAEISHDTMRGLGFLGFLDRWQLVKVYAEPSGANTSIVLALLDPNNSGSTDSIGAVAIGADRVRSIRTTFGTGVRGMGIGHLSVWGVGFTTAYTFNGDGHLVSGELGIPGLKTREWLALLATDQALALDVTGPGTMALGPYAQSPVMALVQAAADTDMGLLVERRDDVGLEYLTHETLENKPVDLVLDYTSGMVFAPFQPKDDDKGFTNKVTARRRLGSEATAELAEGRLSTAPFPDGIGDKGTSPETIVHTDDQLPDQAGWRLHLGTWDEMRVASLTLKMANRRMRNLIDAVLRLREGSRVQVVNTPKRYGPDGFDLLVRGTKEAHGEGVFDITLNCTPYGPWTVGAVVVYEDFEDTDYAVEFTNGGSASWARSTTHFNTGAWSLRSGAIANNQVSNWTVTVPTGATEMRFWYWTSSEASGVGFDGDRLLVTVDGALVLRAQGATGWTQKIVPVAGATAVLFQYAKDNSAASGEDAVHIDDLSFTGMAPVRADTAGCELMTAATAAATALTVVTRQGPEWTRSAIELPFNLKAAGEEIQASAITSWAADAFGRTVSAGWGSADSGQAWTASGGTVATDYAVGSGYGQHILTTTNVSRRSGIDHTDPDVDVVVSVTTSATATGGSLYGGPAARYVDGNNLYFARVEFTTGNAVLVDLRKRVAAAESSLGTYTTGITHVAGTYVRCRLQVSGSLVRTKVWAASAVEPETWQVATIDTSLTTSAFVGARSITAAGNTNVNPQVRYDSFEVLNPQVITASRSVNGAVKPHTAGTAISLARPAVAAL
ncbi:hypothetical protein ACWCPF_05545 [Streptomyces sp. NPDC001858]